MHLSVANVLSFSSSSGNCYFLDLQARLQAKQVTTVDKRDHYKGLNCFIEISSHKEIFASLAHKLRERLCNCAYLR